MRALILKALAEAGIGADLYGSIGRASDAFPRPPYAALIVDRGLPDGDGVDFVRRLRHAGCVTPCLMLTARDAVHDRIAGAGADDNLAKPFFMQGVAIAWQGPVCLTVVGTSAGHRAVGGDSTTLVFNRVFARLHFHPIYFADQQTSR